MLCCRNVLYVVECGIEAVISDKMWKNKQESQLAEPSEREPRRKERFPISSAGPLHFFSPKAKSEAPPPGPACKMILLRLVQPRRRRREGGNSLHLSRRGRPQAISHPASTRFSLYVSNSREKERERSVSGRIRGIRRSELHGNYKSKVHEMKFEFEIDVQEKI